MTTLDAAQYNVFSALLVEMLPVTQPKVQALLTSIVIIMYIMFTTSFAQQR